MTFVPNTAMYNKPSSKFDNFATLQMVIKQLDYRWMLVPKDIKNRAKDEEKSNKDIVRQPPPDPKCLVARWPVVTVMGHVDHGKTTLLDKLRNTNVVQNEFGGITQHIGAFLVTVNDKKITFLDTPGHAAFSTMRMRGASVTDVVVLVVAADDGVMEQTDESIRMAREANVPIVIAINKIDKPQADIDRTKRMLLQRGLELEEAGGDVQAVPISALKGTNLDQLIDAILIQAEVMQLKADPTGRCEGVVIESRNDAKKGKIATVLVQRGTLREGAVVVAGEAWARVRTLTDERQVRMRREGAPPATPAEVTGWRQVPNAGEIVLEVDTEKRAKEVVEWREAQNLIEKAEKDSEEINKKNEEHQMTHRAKMLERRSAGYRTYRRRGLMREKAPDLSSTDPQLTIIIKGDVDGSVEAILDVLMTYKSDLCKLDVAHFDVGQVSLYDVTVAEPFNGIIYAFNVGVLDDAKALAEEKNVRIHSFNVIYSLIDDLKTEINKVLPPIDVENILGEARVQQQFIITENRKKVPVAGCLCYTGELRKSALFKVVRNDTTVHDGKLESMRHMKDEVEKIKTNVDCGLRFADTSVIVEPGDVIICYEKEKKSQTTDWDPGF
ncbi:translation initiation factor IF-2, mitochondrial isoform X2 [Nilaparvata lugens]|nr:translation initiation factor IF-2, mitochondrial isoform X2 [Nilaparvata lugens]